MAARGGGASVGGDGKLLQVDGGDACVQRYEWA